MYDVRLIEDENLVFEEEGIKLETLDISANSLHVGYIKYSYLGRDILESIKDRFKDSFLEMFCDIFEIMDEEAAAILDEVYNRGEVLYLNKIDIGLHKGNGIGKLAMEQLIKTNEDIAIVLFSYPMPIRWQMGFDKCYMAESAIKLENFYKSLGFRQMNDTKVFVK